MSQLACNIVIYRPDPEVLAAKFSPRHADKLLAEAATLIDRCLADFREYSSLDHAWHHFLVELGAQEKRVDLARKREGEGEPVPAEEVPEEQPAAPTEGEGGESAAEAPAGEVGEEEPPKEETVEAPEKTGVELRAELVQRKKDLAAPGQPFALNEHRDLALKRLCRDYEAALDRACVAADGLKSFYGCVGLTSPIPSEAETLSTSINNLAMWIRSTSEWLVQYRLREEEFTRVVSLRAVLGRGAWTQLKHSRENYSMKLQVPAELFRGHENCRLLGIGATVVGEVGTVPWSMVVRLPEEALFERAGQSVEEDQSTLPPCLLGRVENRRSPRSLEICGSITLKNASPVGRSTPGGVWSVEINRPSGAASESFGHLEDVLLELRAVGTPRGGKR